MRGKKSNPLNSLFSIIQVENKLEIKIERFVRKIDGIEIDENETFMELLKSKDECWLIALQPEEDFGI